MSENAFLIMFVEAQIIVEKGVVVTIMTIVRRGFVIAMNFVMAG